ncbi:hypothetical protein NQ314_006882 [Rhamnusium bicolor]|uniref:Uncharacterized protein n=1 Tax=Rhamnusium bicolor TaxID=1586634 RepID=A0AAV8YVK6_9CUCU|nr:hypothetical protein NQ314_006882 [Rhamnusium bicolor]
MKERPQVQQTKGDECGSALNHSLRSPDMGRSDEGREDETEACRGAQRIMALRVCSGYRTVSREALLVISSMPPIELLAHERRGGT